MGLFDEILDGIVDLTMDIVESAVDVTLDATESAVNGALNQVKLSAQEAEMRAAREEKEEEIRRIEENEYRKIESQNEYINNIESIVLNARKSIELEKANHKSEAPKIEEIPVVLQPNEIECDSCGEIFDKSVMRKCKKCGEIICPSCRSKHICNTSIIKKRLRDKEAAIEAKRQIELNRQKSIEDNYNNAVYLEHNVRGPQDLSEALPFYVEAAKNGNADAQFRIGRCYAEGEILERNEDEAVFWFLEAVSKSNNYNFISAWIFEYYAKLEGVPDFNKIDYWYNKIDFSTMNPDLKKYNFNILCMSYYRMGLCYYNGDGIKKDLNKAAEYFVKSEDGDDYESDYYSHYKDLDIIGDAQFQLGISYEIGDNVEKDIENAFNWYSKSALNGNAKAQYRLALFYENGEVVAKDINEAFSLYSKSAENGHPEAQFKLGKYYYEGICVPKNLLKVKYWIERAIVQDNEKAIAFATEHNELNLIGASHVTYQANGDIIQGNVGILAKDDAVVNRAYVSLEKNTTQNSHVQDYIFCVYCGKKLPSDARFCMSCGREIINLE